MAGEGKKILPPLALGGVRCTEREVAIEQLVTAGPRVLRPRRIQGVVRGGRDGSGVFAEKYGQRVGWWWQKWRDGLLARCTRDTRVQRYIFTSSSARCPRDKLNALTALRSKTRFHLISVLTANVIFAGLRQIDVETN